MYQCFKQTIHSPIGWEGEYCENDQDGCSQLECFEGVDCYDVEAPDSGAVCGACPDGYEGDGEKCNGTHTHTRASRMIPL